MTKFMLILSACALALAGHALADPSRSAADLRGLPPAEADQVAKSDLSSILLPERRFDTGLAPAHRERGVSFVTPAYATEFNGLCRRDRVLVRYTATTKDGKPEDRPMQPYGVEATALYADIGVADGPGETPLPLTPACQALNDRTDITWFPAADDRQAAEVALLLKKVRAQLKDAPSTWSSCNDKCRDAILAATQIVHITGCATPIEEANGALCYDIWMAPYTSIRIKAKRDIKWPGDIQSVTAATIVVVY